MQWRLNVAGPRSPESCASSSDWPLAAVDCSALCCRVGSQRGEQVGHGDPKAGHDFVEVDYTISVQRHWLCGGPKYSDLRPARAGIDQYSQPDAVGDVPLAATDESLGAFAGRDDLDGDVRRLVALVRQLPDASSGRRSQVNTATSGTYEAPAKVARSSGSAIAMFRGSAKAVSQ